MNKKPFYKSKKFWAMAIGCLAILNQETLGFPPETITHLKHLVGTYIVGQGVADIAK